MRKWKHNFSLQNMAIAATFVAIIASVISPTLLYNELTGQLEADRAHARLANLARSLVINPVLPTEKSCQDTGILFIEDWLHLCRKGSGLVAEFIAPTHETLWRSPSSFDVNGDREGTPLGIPKSSGCGASARSDRRRLLVEDIPYIVFDLYVKPGTFRSSLSEESVCLVRVVGMENMLISTIDILTVLRRLFPGGEGIQEAKLFLVEQWLMTVGTAILPPLLMGVFFVGNIRFWFRRTGRQSLFLTKNQSLSDYPVEFRNLRKQISGSIREQVTKYEEILRFLLEFDIFFHEQYKGICRVAELFEEEVHQGRREVINCLRVVSRVRDGLDELFRISKKETLQNVIQIMDESNFWFRDHGEASNILDTTNEVIWEQEKLAKSAGKNIRFSLKRKGARLTYDDGELLLMPEFHVRMIMKNFIENALKWARKEIRITITAEESFIEFMIEDDGQGFIRNGRKIRNPKVVWSYGGKLPPDRVRGRVEGRGLGLYIVWGLATKTYGGEVLEGTSELGGARFVARLMLNSEPPPFSGGALGSS